MYTKNFFKTSVLLGITVLIFACSKENGTPTDVDSLSFNIKATDVFVKSVGAPELTTQQKNDVVVKSYRFLASFNSKAKQANPTTLSKTISHYTVMPVALKISDNESISLSMAHLSANGRTNDGYMIFVNDNRISYPLAYSDTGNWDLAQSKELQEFILERFQAHIAEEIKNADEAKETPLTKGGWTPPDNCWIIVENYETFSYGNCLSGVTWGQNEAACYIWNLPYVLYAPPYGTSHGLAGCVAVALAQIMAYHQHPTVGIEVDRSYSSGPFTTPYSYNWTNMKLKAKASTLSMYIPAENNAMFDIANLMAEIGYRAPLTYVGWNGISGVGSKGPNTDGTTANAANALSTYYTSTLYNSYNIPAIINSLKVNKPVYMEGTSSGSLIGHAWSIEGYESYYRYTWWQRSPDLCPISVPPPHEYEEWIYHDYFWCNWGFEGDGNGNYYSGIFNPVIYGTPNNFSYKTSMLVNITPK